MQDDAPDVVLLDLRLPDASGLEVFERVRAVVAHITQPHPRSITPSQSSST